MFGMIRKIRRNVQNRAMGIRDLRIPGRLMRMPRRLMRMGRNETATSGGAEAPIDRDLNFAHKFDATDEELAKVRDLNETDLYSDGSSKYTRMDARRHDGGDTESLNYPRTPDFKGKGSEAA